MWVCALLQHNTKKQHGTVQYGHIITTPVKRSLEDVDNAAWKI